MIVPANQLPLFNIRPQIQLKAPRRPRLGMQMPIRIRNLQNTISLSLIHPKPTRQRRRRKKGRKKKRELTAAGSNLASSCSKVHALVLGISITPSIITCETWTPLGPNSRARLCANARRANFPDAKAENDAEPFRLAVAPVKMRVGGCWRPVAF